MQNLENWDLTKTAILTIDLQNDFIHPNGAYGRAGKGCEQIAALPARIAPLARAIKANGGVYISAQFTLVPGPDNEPLIAPHLAQLRPFLTKGDFAPQSFGHALVDTLAPADYTIEKVAYSAFFQTRLEYVLNALGIKQLVVGGIVTNGGVASTLRDAHLRNIDTAMLTDGCAAFDEAVHDATLLSLATVTTRISCSDALNWLSKGS